MPLRNETGNCETLQKQASEQLSTEKLENKGLKDELLYSGKRELISAEVCILYLFFAILTLKKTQ